MLSLTKIRDLDLSHSAEAEGASFLSAASGLVRARSFLYVVADDELHLGVFPAANDTPGHLIRLFEGALPASKADRKKLKPDLETLVKLPAAGGYPDGAILALGSGSKRNRRMGALLRLDAHGAVRGSPETVDLAPIFASLDDAFRDPNIEGAVVVEDEVRLFQRGNKRQRENAIVRYELSSFLCVLDTTRHHSIKPDAIRMVDLGEIDGVPFCFTDAAALPDERWCSPPWPRTPMIPTTTVPVRRPLSVSWIAKDMCAASVGSLRRTRSKVWMHAWRMTPSGCCW